jgi:hypothetical protein
MGNGLPDDAKRIVTYRYNGQDEKTVVILSERFPTEAHIPEILARIHGTTVDQIGSVRIML